MKKIILLLSFSLFLTVAHTQNILAVFGNVVDSTGAPVSNLPITIQSDSNSTFFSFINTVSTDINGFFGDTIQLPANLTQGGVIVSFTDCDGTVQSAHVFYNPGNLVLNTSFVYCAGNSGGGGGSSCSTNFVYSPTTMNLNTFGFFATNTGTAPYTYSWSMGDGTSYNTASPIHTYTQTGTYTPCLTITDATGCVATYCDSLYAQVSGGGGGSTCSVNYTYSSSPTGIYVFMTTVTGLSPISYNWSFYGGTPISAQGSVATATFNTPGWNSVCVDILTADSCTAYFCDTLWISSASCGTSFTYNATVTGAVNFTSSSLGTAPFTYFWDFGDSTTSTLPNPTHTYSGSGVYTACLTITDSTGCVDTQCQPIIINNPLSCNADFVYQQSVTGDVYFYNQSTGGTAPYSYLWDFGDGNTSTLNNPVHTYNNTGNYNVCLTITDALGCIDIYCTWISASGTNCSVDYTYTVNTNGSYTFTASATGAAPYVFFWDLGDGTTGNGQTITHTFSPNAGIIAPCVNLLTADSCIVWHCDTIAVGQFGMINGVVNTGSFLPPTDAMVYLIKHDSVAGTLTAVDSMLAIQGYFHFDSIPFDDYLVKAALLPTDPDYSNNLPTYYTQNLYWHGATTVSISMNNPMYTAVIDLIAGTPVGNGPGFIGGLISQGANRGGPGDPLENISVLLFDSNLTPVTHTLTDINGNYGFSNLPYGTYYLYVEVMGRVTTHFQVIIDANKPAHTTANFDVNTDEVISNILEIFEADGIQVFPNPTSGQVNLQLDLKQNADLNITITDMRGQQVLSEIQTLNTGEHLMKYDINNLPNGIYLLNIVSETNVVSYKIVKF